MIIVMSPGARPTEVAAVERRIRRAGGNPVVSRGSGAVLVHVPDSAELGIDRFARLPGVLRAVPAETGHPLVGSGHATGRSVVGVSGVDIGPHTLTVIAGPCAVETPEQTLEAAMMARRAGATLLRGGAFKPRTSPYAFQGLGRRGLEILSDVRAETGLPVVTEVVASEDVDLVAEHADMLQIGARNMQNFALLHAAGAVGKPVLLKRGLTATIEEWCMAAEYIARGGCHDIVLCERGIRTYETSTRNTLDVAAVPVVQQRTHLPVIVDPSHSGGRRDLVLPLSRAGVAAGADGVIVDVHPDPAAALCDGPQALIEEDLPRLSDAMTELAHLTGRNRSPRRGLSAA